MAVFARDFGGFLFPIAIFESLAGVLKKSTKKKVFWIALTIETIWTVIQSAALLTTVSRGSYSELERRAPYMTVISDAFLLLSETVIVKKLLREVGVSRRAEIGTASVVTGFLSFVTVVILGLLGLPIFLANSEIRDKTIQNSHCDETLVFAIYTSCGHARRYLFVLLLPTFLMAL